MWVHGAATAGEYFEMFQAYSLADVAKNIQCPTFVAEAENDRRRGGGKDLYNALQCPKELCSLQQVRALANTARQAAARYFSKRCLVGSIPSLLDEIASACLKDTAICGCVLSVP